MNESIIDNKEIININENKNNNFVDKPLIINKETETEDINIKTENVNNFNNNEDQKKNEEIFINEDNNNKLENLNKENININDNKIENIKESHQKEITSLGQSRNEEQKNLLNDIINTERKIDSHEYLKIINSDGKYYENYQNNKLAVTNFINDIFDNITSTEKEEKKEQEQEQEINISNHKKEQ